MDTSNIVSQLETEYPTACLILTSALKDGTINIEGTPSGFRAMAKLLNQFADHRDANNADLAIGVKSDETTFLDDEGELLAVFRCVDAAGFQNRVSPVPRRGIE